MEMNERGDHSHFFSAISNKSFVRETTLTFVSGGPNGGEGKADRSVKGQKEGGERVGKGRSREEIASRLPAEKGDLRSPNRKFATTYAAGTALYFHLREARDRGRDSGQSSLNLLTIAVASRHG